MSRYRARSKYNIYKVPKKSSMGCVLYFMFLPVWLPLVLLFLCFTNPYILLGLLIVGFIVIAGPLVLYFLIFLIVILFFVLLIHKLRKKPKDKISVSGQKNFHDVFYGELYAPKDPPSSNNKAPRRSQYSIERYAVECNAYLDHQDEMAQYEDVLNDNNTEQNTDPGK